MNQAAAETSAQLALSGELTIYCAHELRTLLLTALGMNQDVCIDLGEVSDIDTAGLQLLLISRRELEENSHRLLIHNCPTHLTGLLKLYQLA
ncbi:MAG: STAS domain-containing protein [Methylococcaceae bacterium]